jgi:hypothetical protein
VTWKEDDHTKWRRTGRTDTTAHYANEDTATKRIHLAAAKARGAGLHIRIIHEAWMASAWVDGVGGIRLEGRIYAPDGGYATYFLRFSRLSTSQH